MRVIITQPVSLRTDGGGGKPEKTGAVLGRCPEGCQAVIFRQAYFVEDLLESLSDLPDGVYSIYTTGGVRIDPENPDALNAPALSQSYDRQGRSVAPYRYIMYRYVPKKVSTRIDPKAAGGYQASVWELTHPICTSRRLGMTDREAERWAALVEKRRKERSAQLVVIKEVCLRQVGGRPYLNRWTAPSVNRTRRGQTWGRSDTATRKAIARFTI